MKKSNELGHQWKSNSAGQYVRRLDSNRLSRELLSEILRQMSIAERDSPVRSPDANLNQHGHRFGTTTQAYVHHSGTYTKAQFSNIIRKNVRKAEGNDRK